MSQPLILTLQLDATAQAFYEDLRRRYFPPERNLIPAHLSLFHHLPDEESIRRTLHEAAGVTSSFPLTRPTLRSIGRGVAVFLESEALTALHATLSTDFQSHLIPQDRQRFQPHIVVQNKVDPETAKQTLLQLQSGLLVEPLLEPLMEPHAIGLTLWRYHGGPWEHVCDFSLLKTT